MRMKRMFGPFIAILTLGGCAGFERSCTVFNAQISARIGWLRKLRWMVNRLIAGFFTIPVWQMKTNRTASIGSRLTALSIWPDGSSAFK
jgi:hypothetical protein